MPRWRYILLYSRFRGGYQKTWYEGPACLGLPTWRISSGIMDPYKILGISEGATEHEIKRAYLAMASKYHPDHGGDAWVFEQIRLAYEQLSHKSSESVEAAHSSVRKEEWDVQRKRARQGKASRAFPSDSPSTSVDRHFLLRHLPLQTETAWFILINVLDLVLTNVLLQRHAIEANPLANYVFVHYGFRGMIVFKLASVLFVCVAAQLIALKSISKAKWLLWFGCSVVGLVLVYSGRLILTLN